MSATTVSATAEHPPITILLPLLQVILSGTSSLLRLAFRLLLAVVSPVYFVWPIIHAFLSPIIIVINITLEIVLFTPFSILRTIAVSLYPLYAFCVTACIFGAAVGILGHYLSTTVLGALGKSKYFSRPPHPPPAAPPSTLQGALRKRKRKSVRIQ